MGRTLRSACALIIIVSLCSPLFAAKDPVYDFYNGLAEVIETYENDPELCVKKSEEYIHTHIGPLQKMMEQSRRRAETAKLDEVSEAEMKVRTEKAMAAMQESDGFKALNRFMTDLQSFSMEHPRQGEQIADILSEYGPEEDE